MADVARFFPSIYTHSLPWAINGKAVAKADTNASSATIFGNRLDLILRQSQSRQTIGIAVGPDTSKVVSEILMSSVDDDFQRRSKNKITYIRHVDDYFIGGHTYEECERHLTTLRAALREHELDINESKTKIISTKYIFADDWSTGFDKDLREALTLPFGASKADDDILPILSRIVDRATVSDDDGIIRHCIRIIDEEKAWSGSWAILEPFLAQCAVQFPHAIDYVVRVVAWRLGRGFPIDRDLWTEIAITMVTNKSSAGYDSETVWAMWLLKELNAKLPAQTAEMVIENSNALVLAFLAHFGRHRLIVGRKWKSSLVAAVGDNPLAGAEWPLALELHHLGYAPPHWLAGSPPDAVAAPHRGRVSIIDWRARTKVFGDDLRGPVDSPENALEDYGDDYGSFRNEEDEDDDEDEAVSIDHLDFI